MEIDFTYLETLSDGDVEFIEEFIRTFKETSESLVEKMKKEFESSDFENLGRTAHQLKPSAKMIGLKSGDVLEELQDNPGSATKDLISSIEEECISALSELTKWAKEKGAE